jgi:hypothetical protein
MSARSLESSEVKRLSSYIEIRRRYARSVNLERDLNIADALIGYLPTVRAFNVLGRVAAAVQNPVSSVRSWTITGVYGTGKSAFAHLLVALHGPAGDPARNLALSLLRENETGETLAEIFDRVIPDLGFVRAVKTARREPIAHTILRAVATGAESYWGSRPGRNPRVLSTVLDLRACVDAGQPVNLSHLPELVREIAIASGTGMLILVDELGKGLEHAAIADDTSDLYFLQQLAELPARASEPPVLFVGLLHQAFTEYGQRLTAGARAEWDKVQGRFEDIVFAEAPDEMLRLVAHAIDARLPDVLAAEVRSMARAWQDHFASCLPPYVGEVLHEEAIRMVYPLHPLAALILPMLCAKYAQNDRSLFTFLTSQEPHSLSRFLGEEAVDSGPGRRHLPVLGVSALYDYFIDVGGVGISARPQYQRWTEVHGLIKDAIGLSEDELTTLKVIGTLNLVTSTGPLKASRAMVLAALLHQPDDSAALASWETTLASLIKKRLVTYRRQIDELRIWEGSDFDMDAAVQLRLDNDRRPLAMLLAMHAPLSPVVAERHSYRTGTLRYFERRYVETEDDLEQIELASNGDGVIAYWVGEQLPSLTPSTAQDGRPLVIVAARRLTALRAAARELAALAEVEKGEVALQTDGVARQEVRQRLLLAQRVLVDTLRSAFAVGGWERDTGSEDAYCWVGGELWRGGNFNAALSELCSQAYSLGPTLWNEFLNRRQLTAQGARARRELITALVERRHEERLGLHGYGPEVSMYESALRSTGIHHLGESGSWDIGPPTTESLHGIWKAIEQFFLGATDERLPLDQLYKVLQAPPYGAKEGLIPVLLAAALLYHADDVSLYRDGTFLPVLGAEQFEILVKHPDRFSVKHLQLNGIRRELFKQLEDVIQGAGAPLPSQVRNTTILAVVRPLIRFASSLPAVTRKSNGLSPDARAVRHALLNAREPDRLMFEQLPVACGLEPFDLSQGLDQSSAERIPLFRGTLLRALTELQSHYEGLLSRCGDRLREAFAVSPNMADLREHLRVRAQYMVGKVIEPKLKSFTIAAADANSSERQWLESIATVVAERPPQTWSDDDVLVFEVNLSDIARRFTGLEALQRETVAESRDGFDVRRVTITRPNGEEIHQLVWLDQAEQELVSSHVNRLLQGLGGLRQEHQRRAIAVALAEYLLSSERPADVVTTEAPSSPQGRRETGNG